MLVFGETPARSRDPRHVRTLVERDGAAMKRNESEGIDQLTAVSVAKRQWEKTFDAISDPLMILDGDYVIRRANLALADDLGVVIQRVVGRRCHEVRAVRCSTRSTPSPASCWTNRRNSSSVWPLKIPPV